MKTSAARVHIRGAGLMGRVLALELRRRGHSAILTDPDPTGRAACAWVGAGMLAPASELDGGERLVHDLGRDGMRRWPGLVAGLDVPVSFDGTLVVAHPGDRAELGRFERRLAANGADNLQRLDRDQLRRLEPALDFPEALFLPGEGQVHNRAFLDATNAVLEIQPPSDEHIDADWTIDCRGLAARAERFPELRGVRGELIHIHTPEVALHRPVRVLHPRWPLYIVPRPDHRFIVGASQIESEDRGPVSLRSALELLSAAHALHPGFAEARIVDMATQLRPAFPDHLPRIHRRGERDLAINGLFRHGFLLAPALAGIAADLIEGLQPGSPVLAVSEQEPPHPAGQSPEIVYNPAP